MNSILIAVTSLFLSLTVSAQSPSQIKSGFLLKSTPQITFPIQQSKTNNPTFIIPKTPQNNISIEIQKALEFNKQMIQKQGGATSGGNGDDVGFEASRALRLIFQMISQDDGTLYTKEKKEHLLAVQKLVKVLVVDSDLQGSIGNVFQNGFAYSYNDGENVLMLIQRDRWQKSLSPMLIEKVLHHELAVLVGLEKTGEYDVTNNFLQKRLSFWHRIQSEGFVCTFGLFSKVNGFLKFMGSSGVVKRLGAAGGFATLAYLEERRESADRPLFTPAIILRYVISSEGYLRAALSEATVLEKGEFRNFDELRSSSDEKIYFTPYDLVEPQGSTLDTWGKYSLQVSCSKISEENDK